MSTDSEPNKMVGRPADEEEMRRILAVPPTFVNRAHVLVSGAVVRITVGENYGPTEMWSGAVVLQTEDALKLAELIQNTVANYRPGKAEGGGGQGA